jgi:hypothetical protein
MCDPAGDTATRFEQPDVDETGILSLHFLLGSLLPTQTTVALTQSEVRLEP